MTIEVPATLHVWSQPQQERALHGIGSSQRTSESQLSERHLGKYFSRYRLALYIVFAAATSLSVAWNWNWLTGAEVFRIMAALPCTFMMLMCMKGYSGCDLRRAGGDQQDD